MERDGRAAETPAQRRIVEWGDGPVVVIVGVGRSTIPEVTVLLSSQANRGGRAEVSKYAALGKFLASSERQSVRLTFDEVAALVDLPASAFTHRAWWANQRDRRHVQARAWIDAGFAVDEVALGGHVIFVREASSRA
jgi:hypothetical protein